MRFTNLKAVCFFTLVVLFFVFACGCRNTQNINSQNEVNIDVLVGTWKFDGVTRYTFDGKGSGKMVASDSEYEFNYRINDDELKIDFISDSAQDSTYEFNIDDKKLTLCSKVNNKGLYKLVKEN